MYSEYRIHPARLTLVCMRNSPFASQLPYKERKWLLSVPVRLHSVFSRRDGHVRFRSFDILRSIPRSTYSIQDPRSMGYAGGPPAYSKTLTRLFKGIKLGQQDKDKACYIRFFFYRSFSAPRSGISPYGAQTQNVQSRVQTNPGSWDGLNSNSSSPLPPIPSIPGTCSQHVCMG